MRGPAEVPQAPDDRDATQVWGGLRSRDEEEGERWQTPEPPQQAPEAGRTSVTAMWGTRAVGWKSHLESGWEGPGLPALG